MDISLLFLFVSNGLWVFQLYLNNETSCFDINPKLGGYINCCCRAARSQKLFDITVEGGPRK
jgi:hypothetical protein